MSCVNSKEREREREWESERAVRGVHFDDWSPCTLRAPRGTVAKTTDVEAALAVTAAEEVAAKKKDLEAVLEATAVERLLDQARRNFAHDCTLQR